MEDEIEGEGTEVEKSSDESLELFDVRRTLLPEEQTDYPMLS